MKFLSTLWSWMSSVIESPALGTFLLGIVTTLLAQRISAYWAKWRKIDETKLGLYLSWMPFLAEWYVAGESPQLLSPDLAAFQKKKSEILGTLQIMGPTEAMVSFLMFSALAEMAIKKDPNLNLGEFQKAFSDLNYHFCCEIHGEKVKTEEQKQR